MEDLCQFIEKRLMSEVDPDVRYIGAHYVISCHTFICVIWTDPMLFNLKQENTHYTDSI